jgi:uncharacterized protein (UPF0335 family)
LYVLGHLKDEGAAVLHYIIGHCINYDPIITDSFIEKIREFPVSCEKLKLRFPKYKEYCICDFSDYPLYYPSPVIHAIKAESHEVTEPYYINQNQNIEKLHMLSQKERIDNIANRMFEHLKEKKRIEQEIKCYQEELEDIYEKNQLNEYDVSIGKLIRVNERWMIRIDL